MACDLWCGTFSRTADQSDLDFWVKAGMPEEQLKPMIGTKWVMKFGKMTDDRYIFYAGSPDMPPGMAICTTFKFGETSEFFDPMLNENVKLSYKNWSKDSCVSICECSLGQIEMDEKVCPEGLKVTQRLKGNEHTCFYERCVEVDGTYQMEKSENIDAWIKAAKFPCSIDGTYKFSVQRCGDLFSFVDYFPGQDPFPEKFTLDKEKETLFAGNKYRQIMTKVGPHKYLVRAKDLTNGITTEIEMQMTQDGAKSVWRVVEAGVTAKACFKRICDMSGTYKPVGHFGWEKMAPFMGISKEMCDKMVNDMAARWTIKDMGMYQCHSATGVMEIPEMIMKMDEECTMSLKGLPETTFVYSKMGNKLVGVEKSNNVPVKTVITHTGNYIIKEATICGTSCTAKSIYEKVC